MASGDSYSGGIGAGDWVGKDQFEKKGECLEGKNAYAYRLQDISRQMVGSIAYHTACLGAVIADLTNFASNAGKSRAHYSHML